MFWRFLEEADERLPWLAETKTHLSVYIVGMGGIVKLNAVSQVNAVFSHSWLVWVFKMDVPLMLLQPHVHGMADVSETGSLIEVSSFYGTQQSRCLPPHLRTERDPVSEMLRFLFSRIPDDGKVQKSSNSVCYTPSSEPFRVYTWWCLSSLRALTLARLKPLQTEKYPLALQSTVKENSPTPN
jgi:hypothetical protein